MSIEINDSVIADEELYREMQYHPAESREEAMREAARALAVRELLLQEARRRGIETGEHAGSAAGARARTPPDEECIRKLLDSEIDIPVADEESCWRYYENNRSRFRTPHEFDVAHIFFPAPEGDPEARNRARTEAQRLIETLRRPGGAARFPELARRYSKCSSAEAGGRLGVITPGRTVHELEQALYRMKPGEISSDPVETRYGCHVVQLIDAAEGRQLPFEEVRGTIARYLQHRSRNQAIHHFVAILAQRAKIRGVELS